MFSIIDSLATGISFLWTSCRAQSVYFRRATQHCGRIADRTEGTYEITTVSEGDNSLNIRPMHDAWWSWCDLSLPSRLPVPCGKRTFNTMMTFDSYRALIQVGFLCLLTTCYCSISHRTSPLCADFSISGIFYYEMPPTPPHQNISAWNADRVETSSRLFLYLKIHFPSEEVNFFIRTLKIEGDKWF